MILDSQQYLLEFLKAVTGIMTFGDAEESELARFCSNLIQSSARCVKWANISKKGPGTDQTNPWLSFRIST